MSKIMEDRINERVKIIVLKMLADGNLSKEQIAAFTDLTVEQVESIEAEFKTVSALDHIYRSTFPSQGVCFFTLRACNIPR